MTTQHTPLPWVAGPDGYSHEIHAPIGKKYGGGGRIVAYVVGGISTNESDFNSAQSELQANAALIVRAVNNHEALLASLKRVLTWAECYASVSDIDTFTGTGPLSQDCREARALISAATEQPKP